jgi:cytochrome P450
MNVLERDFFTDAEVLQDPAPYYVALRERGTVWREPHKGVFMLSGVEEILEVYTDHQRFSAIVGPVGPLVDVPQPEEGESWAAVIERRRHEIPLSDQLMTMDPPAHTRHRALAGKLFTPRRMKENEEFIWALADQLIDEFADRGEMEFNDAYAKPFTLLVIADLLGVPREDHETFRGWLGGQRGNVGDPEGRHVADQVFANLAPYFTQYIEQRRATPWRRRHEPAGQWPVLRWRAPEVADIVRLASVFFAAGQETTARMLAAGMRFLCEYPTVAEELRNDPERSRTSSRSACASRGPSRAPSVWRCAIRASPASTSRRGPSSWR